MTVRVVDHGLTALLQRVAKTEKATLDVGVLEGDGEAVYEGMEATVLDVALFNEFGTETIPARSFLRAWFDENYDINIQRMRAIGEMLIKRRLPVEVGLERFGLFAAAAIQKRIADGIPPPNAPSTIARKGSSTPLIDTGQLRSSISYQVK